MASINRELLTLTPGLLRICLLAMLGVGRFSPMCTWGMRCTLMRGTLVDSACSPVADRLPTACAAVTWPAGISNAHRSQFEASTAS